MWQCSLATAVCLCRCVKRRLERKGRRMVRGRWGGLLKEQGVGWKMQELWFISALVSKLLEEPSSTLIRAEEFDWMLQREHYPPWAQLISCCGKPQAVRGWVGSSFLDSGVPLPPVVCPGPSAECVNCGGTGPKWRNPADSSEPPGHLPRCPVWEFVLPGQWNKRRRQSVFCLLLFFSLVNRDNNPSSQHLNLPLRLIQRPSSSQTTHKQTASCPLSSTVSAASPQSHSSFHY